MRKVKNKKVLRKIAWATLRENKKKNVLILLAVILTSMMFTTLFSVVLSLNATTQNATMRQVGGKAMAGLKYMLPEDYEKIKNDPETVDVSYRILVGSAMNKKLLSVPTEVNYATAENAENMFCEPTTGKMPEEKMDIAMSTRSLDKLGVAHKLGEKVPIDLQIGSETTAYDFTLCGFWEGDPVAMAQQAFVSREFCDEVAPAPKERMEVDASNSAGYWMIDFSFKNSFNLEDQTIALLQRNGYDPENTAYGLNWAYTLGDVDIMTLAIGAGILLLILLSGALIIYNVFYINILADIHSYGLLKTIGTTGKQIKKLIRYQSLLFSVAGLPFGLVIGTAAGKVMFQAVAGTMAYDEKSYVFSVSPFIYLFSAVFTLLTVFISCSKPGRTASKVSPVEAVSYSMQQEKVRKHKKAHRFSSWHMAWSGLGRKKKKVFVVVLSLSLSLLLVNGIYSVVHGFDPDLYLQNQIVGDFSIQDSTVRNFGLLERNYSGVSEEDRAYFDSIDGVKQSNIYWMAANFPLTAEMKKPLQVKEKNMQSIFKEEFSYYMDENLLLGSLYGVDDFVLDNMKVYDGSIDKEKFAGGKYAVVYGNQIMDETDDGRIDFYRTGDTVEVEFEDGKKKSYEVMAVAELPYPFTTQSYSLFEETVCIPSEDILSHTEEKGALYSVLQVEKDKQEQVQQELEEYVEKSDTLSLVSKASYMKEYDGYVSMIYLVGYALAGVLALIGILNFINAIVTGMLARRREFAMMEAVGMTEKQLTAMLVWEGLCYVLCTMVFAILANFCIVVPLVRNIAGEIWFFRYHGTIVPLLICLPFLLLFAVAVPYISCQRMKKTSVVERMRIAE